MEKVEKEVKGITRLEGSLSLGKDQIGVVVGLLIFEVLRLERYIYII